jgi:hypothetical protein
VTSQAARSKMGKIDPPRGRACSPVTNYLFFTLQKYKAIFHFLLADAVSNN